MDHAGGAGILGDSLSLSLSIAHTLSLSLTHTHSLSLSLTHTHTLSLSAGGVDHAGGAGVLRESAGLEGSGLPKAHLRDPRSIYVSFPLQS